MKWLLIGDSNVYNNSKVFLTNDRTVQGERKVVKCTTFTNFKLQVTNFLPDTKLCCVNAPYTSPKRALLQRALLFSRGMVPRKLTRGHVTLLLLSRSFTLRVQLRNWHSNITSTHRVSQSTKGYFNTFMLYILALIMIS